MPEPRRPIVADHYHRERLAIITRCPSTAYLTIDGSRAGIIRCYLEAGHDRSHRFTLDVSWQDELAPDWPEAYDPDETFDVDVPTRIGGACGAQSSLYGEAGKACTLLPGHDGPHQAVPGPRLDAILREARDEVNGPRCAATHPRSESWRCTRPAGHNGEHTPR